MKKSWVFTEFSWETQENQEMCETTLAGPLKWRAFYCFCGKENGGDKRDNLNWQMAFLNLEKVISQIFEVGPSARERM